MSLGINGPVFLQKQATTVTAYRSGFRTMTRRFLGKLNPEHLSEEQ